MEENKKIETQPEGRGNQDDCGCEGGNCQPKKSNLFTKIFFAVILMAAVGIIAVKIFYRPSVAANKEAACKPGSSACCDTTKAATCDTTKGSACCPKSKRNGNVDKPGFMQRPRDNHGTDRGIRNGHGQCGDMRL